MYLRSGKFQEAQKFSKEKKEESSYFQNEWLQNTIDVTGNKTIRGFFHMHYIWLCCLSVDLFRGNFLRESISSKYTKTIWLHCYGFSLPNSETLMLVYIFSKIKNATNAYIYLFFIGSKMYYSLQLIVCIMKQFLNIGSYLKEIIRVKGDPKLS